MKRILPLALMITTLLSCNKKDQQANTCQVDETASTAEWKGSAPDHFHVGSFKVTGKLNATGDGHVSSGDFTIPIASIEDFDLQEPVKTELLNDLKSANFFNLAVHPNASFHITKMAPYTGADTSAIAGANYLVTGDFTMIGNTHSLTFPAKITTTENGISTEAKFKLDRTQWDMNIYSDPTQRLYILPDVNIHLKVYAAKLGK
jgi:polyisoprenoid-binding protein YceI